MVKTISASHLRLHFISKCCVRLQSSDAFEALLWLSGVNGARGVECEAMAPLNIYLYEKNTDIAVRVIS